MRGAGGASARPAALAVATLASAPPAGPAPRRRRRRPTLSTYLLLGPALAVLLAFFLAPLYYVFLFSTGERYQGVTKAAASINGELTSFSWDRWRELLATDITVHLFNATVTMPLWVFGLAELALLAGVLRGSRLPRHGGKVVVGLAGRARACRSSRCRRATPWRASRRSRPRTRRSRSSSAPSRPR